MKRTAALFLALAALAAPAATNVSRVATQLWVTNKVNEIVQHVVTENVRTNHLCTVAAAQAMTNGLPSWTKSASKPTYTATEVGAVPTSRTINGKVLSSDVSLVYSDVGAKSDFEIGSGLNEREVGNLYCWRRYTYTTTYTEVFTTSVPPSIGSRVYKADGSLYGYEWSTVMSYTTDGGGTIGLGDYSGNTLLYRRFAEYDITATPYISVVDEALVLTNGAVKTLAGTSITADNIGAVPTSRKVNGSPLTQDITIEGMTDNALVLTNDVVKTKSGTAITAGQVGAYSTSEADAAFYPKASGEAWSAYWDGDEVRVTITNYYGMADIPHLYMEQRTNETGTAQYKIVWDEITRWNKFLGTDWSWTGWGGAHAFKTNVLAQIASINANKADRSWGFYDSHTGEYAPDGYTQISSSNIIVAAGMGYQRTVTTSGDSYWVLTANEPFVYNGTTNGAFQVKDADGNVQIEIVKGDKRTVGARCGGVSVSGRTLIANYAIVASAHPTLEVCTDLASPSWLAETSASCPATVVWSGSSGAYVASVTPKSASATSVFVRASYLTGGETYLRSNVKMEMAGGILCTNGIDAIEAVRSGNAIYWRTTDGAADSRTSVDIGAFDFNGGTNFTRTLYTVLTNLIIKQGGTVNHTPTFE